MGLFKFRISSAHRDYPAELWNHAHVISGPEGMPLPTSVEFRENLLSLAFPGEESGQVAVPFVPESGQWILVTTGTLVQRDESYSLAGETARGQLNIVRNFLGERFSHNATPANEMRAASELSRDFAQCLAEADRTGDARAEQITRRAIELNEDVARILTRSLIEKARQDNSSPPTRRIYAPGCGMSTSEMGKDIPDSVSGIRLPISWAEIEPEPEEFDWTGPDEALQWGASHANVICGGPVFDFHNIGLPPWLGGWNGDLQFLAERMGRFANAVLERYGDRISDWSLIAGCNCKPPPPIDSRGMLWLTAQFFQALSKHKDSLRLGVGLAQPWGEYVARSSDAISPIMFADALARCGLSMNSLELELRLGDGPRDSLIRPPIEMVRLFDLYSMLSIPLHINLRHSTSDVGVIDGAERIATAHPGVSAILV